jgi:hypothetical protein
MIAEVRAAYNDKMIEVGVRQLSMDSILCRILGSGRVLLFQEKEGEGQE